MTTEIASVPSLPAAVFAKLHISARRAPGGLERCRASTTISDSDGLADDSARQRRRHPLLLLLEQVREHGQGQDAFGGGLGDGELSAPIAEARVRLGQVH